MCLDKNRFCQNVHPDLMCPICLSVLCLTSVIDNNDHAFCEQCISKWLESGGRKCPIGNEIIMLNNLKPICRIIKNLLSDLKVYCKFAQNGCDEILSYENYISHEISCKFNPAKITKKNNNNSIINSSKIVCYKSIKFLKASFGRMKLMNENSEIISTDGAYNLLHINDINGNLLNSFNPDGQLKHPMCICISHFNKIIEILVGDYVLHKILVFSENFKYKRSFGNESLKVPEFITVDNENVDDLAYVSDYRHNEITVWNIINSKLTATLKIDSPYSMKIFNKQLYVVSPAQFEPAPPEDTNDPSNVKPGKITKGSNCIFVLDKTSFDILKTIKLNNWMTPSALHLDQFLNIYTLAYDIDENNSLSKYKYLFILNKNGDLIKKYYLDEIQVTGDMIVHENELIFSINNELKIIQFK